MKVKIFWGSPITVEEKFNKWAKGKALTKDVIIHTEYLPYRIEQLIYGLVIAVYYPEGSQFDTET